MRRALAVVVATLGFASPASAYDAGAGVADITPPAAGIADPSAFGTCIGFTGPRTWAFDEPYVDVDASGDYTDGDLPCDANLNGRYDRTWYSGAEIGDPAPARVVLDPLSARAFAIRAQGKTLVVVSVGVQGLFNTYIDQAVAKAKTLDPSITDMVVSSNHNESSPDTIGIYGGPATPAVDPLPGLPAASGIDDYYMDFLTTRIAAAAHDAVQALQPATLHADKGLLPSTISVNLSNNWPLTDDAGKPSAIDPRLGVLQARKPDGTPIFTVMSLAAHNQEIGHGDPAAGRLSADWPGAFAARVAAQNGGTGIFLVGDNGAEEDPVTVPPAGGEGTPQQAQATGRTLADAALSEAATAPAIGDGAIKATRSDFCVPLENNLFRAAAAAGLFGARHTYLYQGGACAEVPAGQLPDGLKTTVTLADVGPDLQFIVNPGEGFPPLLLGSHFGFEDVPAECNGRANPPVPTWLSHAEQRFQVGLGNDFIGYEIPPWAYIGNAGVVAATADPDCNTGSESDDSAGHHHKLETEGVGPTASGLVANALTDLEKADAPDPEAVVAQGRYEDGAGKLSRLPTGAVSLRLLDGSTVTGTFIDYNGAAQAAPDLTTRGVRYAPDGCVARRIYLDTFPKLAVPAATGPLGCKAVPTPTPTPSPAATETATTAPSATATTTASPSPTPTRIPCVDRRRPKLVHIALRGRRLSGRTTDRGCHNKRRLVRAVFVRYRGHRHRAHGRARWRVPVPRRVRRVVVIVVDTSGNRIRQVVRLHR